MITKQNQMSAAKKTQPLTAVCTFTSKLWGINAGQIIQVKKVYFRNGEHHYKGNIEGEEVDLPAVFFTEA